MAVNGCYFNSFNGWAYNEGASGTQDFEIPPGTILATSTLVGVEMAQDGMAYSGILEYRKRDPNTGIDQVITVGNTATANGLAPTVLDSDVDSVTFAINVVDFGEGDFGTGISVLNQIWFT